MKRFFFAFLIIFFCICLCYEVIADTTANDIDQLHKRFDISPVYSCLKGNNLYILTENGPENAPKYGDEAGYDRRGSEIGYYNLDTGIYNRIFTKFYEDTVSGAINYFTVDDAQENIDFVEQVCVGQLQQNDYYYISYSIKNKTARVTSLVRYFDDSALYDKTKYPVYDREYFRYTDKLSSLLKKKDTVLKNIDKVRFGGNNKLYIIRDVKSGTNEDEAIYRQELGYIDLDSEVYVKLLQKKEEPGKSKGELKLLSAAGNEISFQDFFNIKNTFANYAYITYSFSAGSDTVSITDCKYKFHNTYDGIESLIGTKINISGFKDIGQYGVISGLADIYAKFPDISELVLLKDRFYVVMKKSGLHELGFIDTGTLRYNRLLQKESEFNEYFVQLKKAADKLTFIEYEEFSDPGSSDTPEDNKAFSASVVFEYFPAGKILEIKDAYLNTLFGNSNSQIKFTPLIGKRVKLKDYSDTECYFSIKKMVYFSDKYPGIKDMFLYNNRLYTISRNGINGGIVEGVAGGPDVTTEIGYIDLKTNKYTRLLKKAESSECHGILRFISIGRDNIEFYDYNKDNTNAVYYKLFTAGNSLKITDMDPKKSDGLIGMKLKLSEFKDVDYFFKSEAAD